jgi:transglutaminase-like putative cysteine protease
MIETRLGQRGFVWAALILLASLAPHLPRFPWWLSGGLLALVALRLLQRQRMGVAVPKPIRLVLVLGLTLLVGWHYGSLVGRHAGSALLGTMLVLKLMESERRRDARMVAVFSLFVLLTQFLFSESLGLTLYVGFCALLIFAGLREFSESHGEFTGWRAQIGLAWRQRLRPALLVGVMALPLTLCLFLLFPRLGSPLWGAPLDPAGGRTGISDSMSPGDISVLLADDSPAFRVTLLEGQMPPRSQRFWRGPVLWYFDGRTWTRPGYLFNNLEAATVEARREPIRYELIMEPTEQPWVLALDMPTAVPEGLRVGADQVLRAPHPIVRAQRFELSSATDYLLEPELRLTWRRLALELPTAYNPRSQALARSWRAELGGDDAAIIERALYWFNREFSYSLVPPLLGLHSVDEFLFETREGFCEHYASAFAVLMRAAGIPTRVVTGYLGGEYNALGGFWQVLQSDAHAWNEVWLEGRGWVRVDPTAAVAPERVFSDRGAVSLVGGERVARPWWAGVRDVRDWIGHRWINAVLNFNALAQREVLEPFGVPDADWRDLGLALMAVFLVLSALWLVLALRGPRAPRDPLLAVWRLLGRRLAAVGLERRHNEGPEDWLRRAAAARPQDAAILDVLRNRFVMQRYGRRDPDPREIDELRRSIRAYRPRRQQRPVRQD